MSAYALFFRDTQAAIKGSNPNASFGEVSKIVASMWDSLEADQKQVEMNYSMNSVYVCLSSFTVKFPTIEWDWE